VEKLLNAFRDVLSIYVKMPQLTQIVLAVALGIFAFNAGQCDSDSKINQFRADFAMLQKQATATKQFADSASNEVTRLTEESKSKDATITRLSLTIEIGNKKREQLKGTLIVMEDSLRVTTDTAQIVNIQEGIIYNLKEQVVTAENTIAQQKEIINTQNVKITKLDSAVALAMQRGDSLQIVVDKLINMPKPPRQWISKKTAGMISFAAGVIIGDQLARR